MKTVAVVFFYLSALVYTTDGLSCATCTYSIAPDGLSGLGVGSDIKCKDGGSALTVTTCPAASAGKKAVCMTSKADITLSMDAAGTKTSVDMTIYSRGCHEVDASAAEDGTIPEAEVRPAINAIFDQFNTVSAGAITLEVTKFKGISSYCSGDDCGVTTPISGGSGDGLQCASCTFSEMESDVADFPSVPFLNTDTNCKAGGTSLTSVACDTPAAGKKAVCMRSKGKTTLEWDVVGNKVDVQMTMFTRGCAFVDEGEKKEGSIKSAEIKSQLDELFADFSEFSAFTMTVKSYSGSSAFCSTNNCGVDEDITTLSGARSVLPSVLLVGVLTAIARFF